MEKVIDSICHLTFKNWSSFKGLLGGLVLCNILIVVILLKLNEYPIILVPLLLILSNAFTYLYWECCLPRVAKGKIGIGILISNDTNIQSKDFKDDFLKAFKASFLTFSEANALQFIEIVSQKEDVDSAEAHEVLKNYGLMLFVKMHARNRPVDGKENIITDLSAWVRLKKINHTDQKYLEKNSEDALPSRIMFDSNNRFIEAEFTAVHLDGVIKYLIGICVCLANNVDLGESLFLDSLSKISQVSDSKYKKLSKNVSEKITNQLKVLYRFKINQLNASWQKSHNPALLEQADVIIDKLHMLDPSDYWGHTSKAICDFVLRRDIAGARKHLKKCYKVNDPSWLLSIAFLDAYEGDLYEAYKKYHAAFKMKFNDHTSLAQCEEFIDLIMEAEQEKSQLLFCSGLINYFAKNDYLLAEKNFLDFLEKTNFSDFPVQHRQVTGWLNSISKRLA